MIVLVANKCDLIQERQVDYKTAKEFAEENDIAYIETSCKHNEQVEFVFLLLVNMVFNKKRSLPIGVIKVQEETVPIQRDVFSKCHII